MYEREAADFEFERHRATVQWSDWERRFEADGFHGGGGK
jgi:hypothetical protein